MGFDIRNGVHRQQSMQFVVFVIKAHRKTSPVEGSSVAVTGRSLAEGLRLGEMSRVELRNGTITPVEPSPRYVAVVMVVDRSAIRRTSRLGQTQQIVAWRRSRRLSRPAVAVALEHGREERQHFDRVILSFLVFFVC
jgi:hypothetical protein